MGNSRATRTIHSQERERVAASTEATHDGYARSDGLRWALITVSTA
jgi:hypothetical protein